MHSYWSYLLGTIALVFLPLSGQADITLTAQGIYLTPAAVTDFHSLEARIVGPEGEVYHETSEGEPLSWSCQGCADGVYSVELRTAVRTGTTGAEGKPAVRVEKVETERFTVQGGVIQLERRSQQQEESSFWGQIAGTILDWLIPSAQAQNLTATSPVPVVNFVDNDDSYTGIDFYLACQGGQTGFITDHFCDLADVERSRFMFSFNSTPTTLEMGIGTSATTAALHLATPQTPTILLDSAGTDLRMGGDDDVAFIFTTNNFGPTGAILTLENDLNASINLYPGLGIWRSDPAAPLHVGSHDGQSAKLIVENTAAPTTTAKAIEMFRLVNKGPKAVRAVFDANGSKWALDNNRAANPTAGVKSGRFQIWKIGSGLTQFTLDGFGTGRFAGNSVAVTHINTSSRTRKAGFTPIDRKRVLQQLATVPITRWHYREEEPQAEHVGPVAEDFRAAFGVGDGEHIATVDADGVALAAIQGLYQLVQEQQREIAALKQEHQALRQESAGVIATLAARLEALEMQASGKVTPASYTNVSQ